MQPAAPRSPLSEIVHVHQCLRQEVAEIAQLTRQAVADPSLIDGIRARMRLLVQVYTSHSSAEERHIIPELVELDAETRDELEEQHGNQAALLDRLEALMAQPVWTAECAAVADQLRASIVLHLRLEEEELLPLLCKRQPHQLGLLVAHVIGDRSSFVMESLLALADAALPQGDKAAFVDELRGAAKGSRFEDWLRAPRKRAPELRGELVPGPLAQPTQFNGLPGCAHYARGCRVVARCCGQLYTCAQCHAEAQGHALESDCVWCMTCGAVQAHAGERCVRCQAQFGAYTCAECGIYELRASERIYHCPYCGVCRKGVGLGVDFFHCFVCSADVSTTLRGHTCVEGSTCNACAICCEDLFSLRAPVHHVPCGHLLHRACFEQAVRADFRCPQCRKAMIDMRDVWRRVDALASQRPPVARAAADARRWRCWDCGHETAASASAVADLVREGVIGIALGERCAGCGGYNTTAL